MLPRAALLIWLPLAIAGAALVWARATGRLAPAAFAAAAIALTAVDLARAGVGQNPAIPVEHAEQPATGAIRHLQSRAPGRFAAVGTTSVVPPIPPNVAMRYRIADARAYDYPVEQRYATVLGARDRTARPARLHARRARPRRRRRGRCGRWGCWA